MRVLMVGTVRTKKSGGMATHTEELISHLRELGIYVEHYKTAPSREYPPIIDKTTRLYTRTIGLSLKLIKDSKKFDIVHIQVSGPMGGFIPAVIGAFWKKMLRFKLVVTFHYGQNEKFLARYKRFFKFVLYNAEMFFVVSQRQCQDITRILGDYELQKIVLIPNGFNSKLFYPQDQDVCRERLGLPQDKKIILNVANLFPVKRHVDLINAMKIVTSQRDDVICYIIGEGPERKRLENLIKTNNLETTIKLVGSKPHEEIPLWMNAADIFVLPSLSESFGIVQIEAMACGVPVVATINGGSEEIITSEDYGLLCPPTNPECLAEKILIALDKKWDKEKIRKYAEQFTWDKIAEQTVGMYNETLKVK
ncbi:glycosyltransferase family 4 protein [Thermococcus sp. GR6]|uniref:glycosyltransferase family 4 protein n=1 Tax=Thermococcus sp. GR6 TaxID=1638256 RepID=UPI00142FD721|nr:glycosyltransferase family 4 protein [Thermococcus sp. GR6]NJE42905.1 glycosyltransferase family 4 protein [Thermococcus sp. GR6]